MRALFINRVEWRSKTHKGDFNRWLKATMMRNLVGFLLEYRLAACVIFHSNKLTEIKRTNKHTHSAHKHAHTKQINFNCHASLGCICADPQKGKDKKDASDLGGWGVALQFLQEHRKLVRLH